MLEKTITKSAVLMLVIVIAVAGCYELYLRRTGQAIAYDDSPALWSDKRANVYKPSEEQIVFIGSSRIKFDLDIPTWKKETGLDAVQLSIVGSSPRPLLEDLANDPDFKGKLIIDVTEPLFFSDAPPYNENPHKNISYFHERTLSQQASFELNQIVESQLVFLDKGHLSLNAQLDALQLPNREGVFQIPVFPINFERTTFDRQTYMTESFSSDPNQVNEMRGIWQKLFSGPKPPPLTDAQITGIIQKVKTCTDKIKARGGKVLFVRTPSSGPFLEIETMLFPRDNYWNRILAITGCAGIHFSDYPQTAKMQCPEFSHLSIADAKIYTKHLAAILSREQGWEMPQKQLLSKI